MKKRLFVLILCVSLLWSIPTQAAVTGTADHFQASRTYENNFSDVAGGSWYYENVKSLYEMGLAQGKAEQTFAPGDSVTVGEAAAFAARRG